MHAELGGEVGDPLVEGGGVLALVPRVLIGQVATEACRHLLVLGEEAVAALQRRPGVLFHRGQHAQRAAALGPAAGVDAGPQVGSLGVPTPPQVVGERVQVGEGGRDLNRAPRAHGDLVDEAGHTRHGAATHSVLPGVAAQPRR